LEAQVSNGFGIFLTATGAIKILSALLDTPILRTSDPLFPLLTIRQVLFVAAILETSIAYYIFVVRNLDWAPWLILWLAIVSGLYRLGLHAVGFRGNCPCLGYIFDWIPGFSKWSDRTMFMALLVIGFGSLWIVCSDWKTSWRPIKIIH
jgi:hypothetical protein